MTRARVPRIIAACGLSCLVTAALQEDARADLQGTAAHVEAQWKLAGGQIHRGAPRFINDDETISFALPSAPPNAVCTTVALVGARGTSFHARAGDVDEADSSEERGSRAQSVAGALSIARCGSALRRLVVTSDSGRGAIELVVGWSLAPLVPLREVLPERTGGPLPPAPDTGDLPALPAPEARAAVAEARARRDGAATLSRETWPTGQDGSGSAKIALSEGCHRLEIFARDLSTGKAAGGHVRVDLDAELRDEVDDRLLSRDRSDAPDAYLETCVGEATRTNIAFAGSLPAAPVLVTHASWPIPDRLPLVWGSEARARMASVMLGRNVPSPKRDAVFLAEGGSGTTPFPIEVEPGGCYLAVAAVTEGNARGIGVRVLVGARDSTDDRGASDNAGVVAFCAEDRKRAVIEIDARGTSLAWGIAVFRVRSGVWEVAR